MTISDFSFADYAVRNSFDQHISASIPGYDKLMEKCVGLSRRFVQDYTTVLDVGCTTGKLLRSIRGHNQASRPRARYLGIDLEAKFKRDWSRDRCRNLAFSKADIRAFSPEATSYITSVFTLQFVPVADKNTVLKKLAKSLVDGGALLIAEKVLASSARLQDTLTFQYYDFKLRSFNEREVLEKERRLRGMMTLWTEQELRSGLLSAGFREVEPIWGDFPFLAFLALK
jgi:tRNA (cmo5U34)-methyltransferase